MTGGHMRSVSRYRKAKPLAPVQFSISLRHSPATRPKSSVVAKDPMSGELACGLGGVFCRLVRAANDDETAHGKVRHAAMEQP